MKEKDKATKKQAGLITLFKLLVFAAVLLTLYFQLANVDWEHATGLEVKHWWALVLAFLLLVPNLWMEFLKWKVITNPLNVEPKLVKNAFWAGVASGFMTPNGWGNFLGRLIFFQKRQTIYIIFFNGPGKFEPADSNAAVRFVCIIAEIRSGKLLVDSCQWRSVSHFADLLFRRLPASQTKKPLHFCPPAAKYPRPLPKPEMAVPCIFLHSFPGI